VKKKQQKIKIPHLLVLLLVFLERRLKYLQISLILILCERGKLLPTLYVVSLAF